MRKVAKNGREMKAIYSLTFLLVFCPFMKNEKVAENGRKVKAIALLCFPFMKNGISR
jgi:hypothetical protein